MQNGTKTVNASGDEHWLLSGKWHRTDGPALILRRGGNVYKAWYIKGKRHREDGPAVVLEDPEYGYEIWMKHDKKHREDGPACVTVTGKKEFFLNGKKLTWAQWRAATKTK